MRSFHLRLISLASVLLFGLISFLSVVNVSLLDRSAPVAVGARASLDLDFTRSPELGADPYPRLAAAAEKYRVGLVKLLPDLSGDQSGQVLVPLGGVDVSGQIARFGGSTSPVRPVEVLESSYPSGEYLVTGPSADRSGFTSWLEGQGVIVRWVDISIGTSLEMLYRQPSFLATIGAVVGLSGSLVLYWAAVRARTRSLRILNGVSAARIQAEDLSVFGVAVGAGAAVAAIVSTGLVAP
ncbi:hypothetical protein [Austwickia chelonae]|uniref:hypothetical protein n=1 Tax=Austwickia chelonae TaxID=100225 RepID=UPI000E252679|nr:hypothetical protein [Austwickia chelonae]